MAAAFFCIDCANNHSETQALRGTAKATKAALTIDGLVVFLGVSEMLRFCTVKER